MFLFTVTRRSTAETIDAPRLNVREHRLAGWVVTTATDDWLSSLDTGGGEVTVREGPPFTQAKASASRHGAGGNGASGTGSANGSADELLFARATFSERDQSVELLKTPLGGRYFYYHFAADGGLYCASHAALLRQAGVTLEEDPQRLPELFFYRYVTAPRTPFKGIDQLQPGQRLRLEFDGGAWRIKSTELFSPPRPSEGEVSRQPDGAYGERAAVALRHALDALKPAGERPHVLLSGGLDSSILFKVANIELGVADSYSASYPFEPEEEDVEKRYALTAAEALGGRHRLIVPTTDEFLRGFVETASVMEEPVVHLQSVLMLLMLRKLPATAGGVVMGEGADGAFGLKIHAQTRKLDQKAGHYRRLRPVLGLPPVLGALRPASLLLRRGGDLVEVMQRRWDPHDPVTDRRHALWRMHAVLDERWTRRRFKCNFDDYTATRAAVIRPYQGRSAYDLFSLMSFMSDAAMVQRQWSALAESAGKWVYYPFHHREVLDCAYSTPWEVKLTEPKAVLRSAARALGVPEFIITRPKADFNANAERWAVPGAVMDPMVALASKVWDETELRRMQSNYVSRGKHAPSAYTFLAMLNYAVWKRLFLNREPLHVLLGELERALAGASPDSAVAAAAN